jgi:hydroxybutyrate-dimer hydrolase
LAKLLNYGWLPEATPAAVLPFRDELDRRHYTNAHGRFSVLDNLCGFSFANTGATGAPAPQVPALQAGIFATGNGVPPTSGVNIVYNDSEGGAKLDLLGCRRPRAADFAGRRAVPPGLVTASIRSPVPS